jgi:hypothetical protein
MRPILFAAAMIGAASVFASTDAMAQLYPRVPSFGARFYGPGFFGSRFFGPRFFGPALYGPGFYGPRFYGPGSAHVGIVRKKAISTRQASTKHVSTKHVSTKKVTTKKVTTKQVATRHVSTRDGSAMRPAATPGGFARPGVRTVIPLPEQELLTAQPEFDCEFKTTSVDDASDQPQTNSTRGQADLATDVTLRMKLDYERECYRHTEMIVRGRLRLLQVSVGETMKAVILGTIETKATKEAQ